MARGRLCLLALVVVVAACGTPAPTPRPTRPPSPPVERAPMQVTANDLQVYLAVRNKALTRLENSVARVEQRGGDLIANVEEFGVAERESAGALGVEWSRYQAIREAVDRLLALQRRQEDARVLALELTRARDDLVSQLALARDPASRQFLGAQLERLNGELAKLETERAPTVGEIDQLRLIDAVRAELAVQQGRQERIQRRVRDLLQRRLPQATATATSG